MTTPTNLAKGFEPRNLKVVAQKGSNQIWAYESTFKGKDSFNIREVYQDANGDWAPTPKGIAVPVDRSDDLCKAIGAIAEFALLPADRAKI